MLELLSDPNAWISLLTLTLLEIVLGIDNIIFISIVADRLPEAQRQKARVLGLILALVMRVGLLFSIAWLVGLTDPVLTVLDAAFSWRDLILLGGGLFLIAKATIEIYETIEGDPGHATQSSPAHASMRAVITQIVLLDLVFSFDSILTAVGLTTEITIMVTAVVLSMMVMVAAARPLSEFVNRHLSIKMLALAFLILIGMVLVADGFGTHVPKGYVYFSLAFSILVQGLVMAARRRNPRYSAEETAADEAAAEATGEPPGSHQP